MADNEKFVEPVTMDNKEAKKALQLRRIQFSGESRRVVSFLQALCTAEDALDYRIAKEVEIPPLQEDVTIPDTNITFRAGTRCIARCPTCRGWVKINDAYCSQCGQAIVFKTKDSK